MDNNSLHKTQNNHEGTFYSITYSCMYDLLHVYFSLTDKITDTQHKYCNKFKKRLWHIHANSHGL